MAKPTRVGPKQRPSGDVPRTFVWPEATGASGYEFQLFRGKVLVFRARSTDPRLVVPRTWRRGGKAQALRRGTYRWYVWPLRANGRPAVRAVVQAELVVAADG